MALDLPLELGDNGDFKLDLFYHREVASLRKPHRADVRVKLDLMYRARRLRYASFYASFRVRLFFHCEISRLAPMQGEKKTPPRSRKWPEREAVIASENNVRAW